MAKGSGGYIGLEWRERERGMRERDKREGRARVTGELGSVHLLAA